LPELVEKGLDKLPESIAKPLRLLWKIVKPLIEGISEVFGNLADIIDNGFEPQKLQNLLNGLGKALLAGIALYLLGSFAIGLAGAVIGALAAAFGAIMSAVVSLPVLIIAGLAALDKSGILDEALKGLDSLPEAIADPLRRIIKIIQPI